MTDFKAGDRVQYLHYDKYEPGEVISVRGDDNDHEAWEWALEEETYLVVLDIDPDDVYYACPGDIEVIEEEA